MSNEKIRQAGNDVARTARERRAQSNVQQSSADIREAIGKGLSPQVAESMGAPLDPTKGYSFEPDARPADLPQPGATPGGAEQASGGPGIFDGKMMGDMMETGGLPDDRDALIEAGIMDGGPPQGTPGQAPQTPHTIPGDPKPEHPVLTSLREDLGIEPVHTQDVDVGGHKWTMRTLSPGELARASGIADMSSSTITERELIYHVSIAAHSIVAIDGVPTYQVFNVIPPPTVTVVDHLRPPKPLRYMAAAELFDFIADDTRTALGLKLYDAYKDRCDSQGAVASYLDDANEKRIRFRCVEEDCGHELFIPPKIVPGTNDIQMPFCLWHGNPMAVVGAETETDLPLP